MLIYASAWPTIRYNGTVGCADGSDTAAAAAMARLAAWSTKNQLPVLPMPDRCRGVQKEASIMSAPLCGSSQYLAWPSPSGSKTISAWQCESSAYCTVRTK